MAVRRRSPRKDEPASHRGVAVNPAKFKVALSARGLTARRLAQLTGLSEVTISHVARGRVIAPTTLERIGYVLSRQPLVEAARELLDLE